jgi:hypothetical protein
MALPLGPKPEKLLEFALDRALKDVLDSLPTSELLKLASLTEQLYGERDLPAFQVLRSVLSAWNTISANRSSPI